MVRHARALLTECTIYASRGQVVIGTRASNAVASQCVPPTSVLDAGAREFALGDAESGHPSLSRISSREDTTTSQKHH